MPLRLKLCRIAASHHSLNNMSVSQSARGRAGGTGRFKSSLTVSVFGLDVSARRYPERDSLFGASAASCRRVIDVRVATGAVLIRGRRLCRHTAATTSTTLPDRRARSVTSTGSAVMMSDGGGADCCRLCGGVVQRVVAGVQQTRASRAAVTRQRRLRAELLVRQRAVLGQV